MTKTRLIAILVLLMFFSLEGISTASIEIRINAGGGDYSDTNGKLFVADRAYTAGGFGYTSGRSFSFPEDIAGTDDDPLYQTMLASRSFSYLFDNLPEGQYQVTLYFMDPWQSAPGERTFDVKIEGGLVLDDYDIIAAAGGPFTAVTETIVTQVSDGQLNIDFVQLNKVPLVSAIAVVSTAGATPSPDISVSPTGLDFGEVEAGTTSDLSVTVSNDGTADLTVTGLASTNSAFSVVSPAAPFTLAPGGSQSVTVRFSPTATGLQNGQLQLSSNDPDESLVPVVLSGNGFELHPDISVLPTGLDFGEVEAGTSSDLSVTVSNDGTADLTVTGLASTHGAFTVIAPATPFTVTVGTSQNVTVRFSPTITGTAGGSLEISSDDPDEGLVPVSLSGDGVEPPPAEPDIGLSATSLNFGPVNVGSSADQSVTIINEGTQPLSVTNLPTTNGAFTVVGPVVPFEVAPNGGTQAITIRFSPGGEGPVSGDLQISSNDPDEGLVTVTLSGEGTITTTPVIAMRINSGGGDYTDTNGNLFVADRAYEAGSFGYSGGRSLATNADIAGTVDDDLYRTVRTNNNFSYLFDNLPEGEYEITFYFMEPRVNGAGQRVFDVKVEGVVALDNYDIYAAAGGKLVAVTETVVASVSDGQLNIDLTAVSSSPFISALAVVSANLVDPEPDISVSPVIKIMPLGDSITFGTYGADDPRPEAQVTGYRQPLYLSLTAAGHTVDFVGGVQSGNLAAPGFDYDHEGHSGKTDDWIADRVYGFLGANPADIVLLHIGTNSLNPSPADVERILDEIDRYEADASTEITVLLARIINRQVHSQMTTDFNNNVEAMALNRIANGDKIIIVDQESALVYPDDLADNLHPNDTGYAKMAGVWLNALNSFLANLDFGNVTVGTFSDLPVTLTNNGTADLEITGLTTSNGAFSIVSPGAPFTISPGGVQPVTLRFNPAVPGAASGRLEIASNDPDEGLVKISLKGNGVEASSSAQN